MDRKLSLISIFVVVLLVLLLFLYSRDTTEFEKDELVIVNSLGEEVYVKVELASDDTQHSKGLSGRGSLCDDHGMLFIFEDDITSGFWMKDTSIPLSIAFISENGTIIDIQDMEPYSLKSHSPGVPYRYALEVNQGFFLENDVDVGDIVIIPEYQ